MRLLTLLLAVALSTTGLAAQAEDVGTAWSDAWGFQDSNQRAVDFAAALAQKRLRDGTDGTSVTVTYTGDTHIVYEDGAVTNNGDTASTVNVGGGIATINGDGNTVLQSSSGSQAGTASTNSQNGGKQ